MREDFEIYDNGKLQTLTNFDNKVTPISVVVMLDTSGSMTLALDLVKQAAEEFLIRLLPEDKGKVGAFNDKIEVKPQTGLPFTNNRDQLIRYLQDLDFGYPTRLYDAVDYGINELKTVDGRKVVLVFTDGADTGEPAGFGRRHRALARRRSDGVLGRHGERVHERQPARADVTGSRAETALRGDGRRFLHAEEEGRAGPHLHPHRAGTAQSVRDGFQS